MMKMLIKMSPYARGVIYRHKVQFEWELPQSLLGVVAEDKAKVVEQVKRAAVLDWVRMKKISWRKGAELLDMTYWDFLALMAEHKILTLDYGEGWLEKELVAFDAGPLLQD